MSGAGTSGDMDMVTLPTAGVLNISTLGAPLVQSDQWAGIICCVKGQFRNSVFLLHGR